MRALLLLAAAVAAAPLARAEDAPDPATDLVEVVRPTALGRALDRARVRPYGWIEAALTTSPDTDGDVRTARVFDDDAEGFRLHQAVFGLERQPEAGCCFDWGFKAVGLWGTDARFLHQRGLLDDQDGEEQWDLLEAHALLRFPAGRGLTVKAGKWTTPMGFEVIEAPNNLLPSRSFLFGWAIPFTHTGVLATLQAGAKTSVSYGVVLGWDVWDDPNDALTHYAGASFATPSDRDTFVVNAMLGPEQEDDEEDLRGVLDVTWTHLWSECTKTVVNADVGVEENAAPDGDDASWYGIAGYVNRKFGDRLSATLRAEWFRDEDGSRLGAEADLFEATIGLDWTPFRCFPNLHVRPEARWDHSLDGPFFDDGEDEDQFSLTLDFVLTF
jgi:hypothetical protein